MPCSLTSMRVSQVSVVSTVPAARLVAGSRGYKRAIAALWAAGLATFGQLYYPQGLLPLIGRDLGISASDAALTMSGATLGLAAAVIPWSVVADRIGRVAAMRIAIVAATVIGLLAPLAPTLPVLITLRVLQGVALGGIPALALTYLGEEVHRADAAYAASSYVAGTAFGGLLGRLTAPPIAEYAGWRLGALVAMALSGIAGAFFLLLLPRAAQPLRSREGASLVRAVRGNLRPAMLALYAQAFLLMGGYVAIYNYLGYRLERPPFSLPVSVTSLLFLAAVTGTVSSRWAGRLAGRHGRAPVLIGAAGVMAGATALTIIDWLPAVLAGLTVLSAAFFAGHAIASGWVTHRATDGTAQAAALYSLAYYIGSSVFGWLGGIAFTVGWWGTAGMVAALCVLAVACTVLTNRPVRPGARPRACC